MRDYGKVTGRFWTGSTGKALRGHPEAQLVAAYLMTAPTSNMIGLYYLPMPTLCHETGLTSEGASKGLRRLSEGGFAYYDEGTETVFVVNMAREQVGDRLAPADNRVKSVRREVEEHIKCPLLHMFLDVYRARFHLEEVRCTASPFEAPLKPLRSQDQDQEHDQDQDQEDLAGDQPPPGPEPEPLQLAPDPPGTPTRDRFLGAMEAASGGLFVASKPGKGGVFKLDAHRKQPEALAIAARIGAWLGAGGDWRTAKGQRLDGRNLGDLDAWAAQAAKWDGKAIAAIANGAKPTRTTGYQPPAPKQGSIIAGDG